jgi:hypothetical protein
MSATTIKIEDPLLSEIKRIKPAEQSLSSYVKETLKHEIQRQRMSEAAHTYKAFLSENAEEKRDLDHWEAAPLQYSPKLKRR